MININKNTEGRLTLDRPSVFVKTFQKRKYTMTDRLRNDSPLEGYHNSLDFAYMIAAFIGLFSTLTFVAILVFARPIEIFFIIHALLSLSLFLGGSLGFYYHYTQNMMREFLTILPVISGLTVVILLYLYENVTSIILDITLLSTAGISGGILVVLIIYLLTRYRAILRIIKGNRKNREIIDRVKSTETDIKT